VAKSNRERNVVSLKNTASSEVDNRELKSLINRLSAEVRNVREDNDNLTAQAEQRDQTNSQLND
jgi:hypothetical protein